MQPNDLAAEISTLEAALIRQQKLLDQAISDNVILAETKSIFHEMKVISDKLLALKIAAAESEK